MYDDAISTHGEGSGAGAKAHRTRATLEHMKRNLTLTVDEEILLEARVVAARRRTSLSSLVRSYLAELAGESDRRKASWRRVRRLIENPPGRVGGKLAARDELHER